MSEKLKTIQKRNNLNEVYKDGEKGNGGAYHKYIVFHGLDAGRNGTRTDIQFQDGARDLLDSIGGVLDVDLLEI